MENIKRDDIEMVLLDKGFEKDEDYGDYFERYGTVVDYTNNELEISLNGDIILIYKDMSDSEIYKIVKGLK